MEEIGKKAKADSEEAGNKEAGNKEAGNKEVENKEVENKEVENDETENEKAEIIDGSNIIDENDTMETISELKTIQKIEWDSRLSVDIKEIDDLQQKMFALLNALIDLKDNNAETKACTNMIAEIHDYSRYFFSREEDYMRKNGYPELDTHEREHRQFIKLTINFRRQIADDRDNFTDALIKTMRDWLVDHILTCDLLYVPFLRTNRFIKEYS